MQVTELADAFGVKKDTFRYYTWIGLLHPLKSLKICICVWPKRKKEIPKSVLASYGITMMPVFRDLSLNFHHLQHLIKEHHHDPSRS